MCLLISLHAYVVYKLVKLGHMKYISFVVSFESYAWKFLHARFMLILGYIYIASSSFFCDSMKF
jgi:hypothetical protein